MKKEGVIQGSLTRANEEIRFRLSLIAFEEDGSKIVYCPALDVYGYGVSETEAENSFKYCLEEFVTYTQNKGTFTDELKRLGWQIPKSRYKNLKAPSMSSLLSTNENFSRIFDNNRFTKYDKEIALPL